MNVSREIAQIVLPLVYDVLPILIKLNITNGGNMKTLFKRLKSSGADIFIKLPEKLKERKQHFCNKCTQTAELQEAN